MQDDTQKRTVNLKAAIVMNETQLPEFVHEKIDSGPRRANHSREHLLGDVRKRLVGLRALAIAG
jgi:hypothetical protein